MTLAKILSIGAMLFSGISQLIIGIVYSANGKMLESIQCNTFCVAMFVGILMMRNLWEDDK